MSYVYNRKTKRREAEKEYCGSLLKFLYKTVPGRSILKHVVSKPSFSKKWTKYQHSAISKKDILPFAAKYGISINKEEAESFNNFNDFFTRKDKEIIHTEDTDFITPAEGKIRYYTIDENLKLKIKNSVYSIEDILQDKKTAEYFRGGTCVVIRLSVHNIHRFDYIDNGKLIKFREIPGELHTVRSISDNYNVFVRNQRSVSILECEHLGKMAQIEIGATFVGKINNHLRNTFKKNEEKGYFEFGGSTVVLLINKDIKFDEDIERMNKLNIETTVKKGEKVGVIC